MKAADRQHICQKIDKEQPTYMIMRSSMKPKSWEIWIPDFLRSDDQTVKAFVWSISFCPFCGANLSDDKNSKEI